MQWQQHITRTRAMLPVIFSLFFLQMSLAQTSIFEYGNARYVRIELHKPIFEDADDLGFFSIASFINVQFPVSNNVSFTGELPYAFSSFDGENESGIGNVGVGINYYGDSGKFKASISVGIPTAGETESFLVGLYADPLERFGAFNPFAVPIKVMLNFYDKPYDGFVYRVRLGPEVAVAKEDFLETELYFGLHAMLGYAFGGSVIQGGISTFSIITEDELDFSERVSELININAEINLGNVKPGFLLRIPLGSDLGDAFNIGVGVSVGFIL